MLFRSQGVKASFDAFKVSGSSTTGGSLVIESPYFSTITYTLLSYVGATVRVEIDGLNLKVPAPCKESVWSFEELRIYVNGVLEYTLGATSGGDAYSHRKNWLELKALDEFTPSRACGAACPGSPALIDPRSTLRGGYQIDFGSGYVSETVDIDNSAALEPDEPECRDSCDCILDLPDITGTDSYDVVVEAMKYHNETQTDSIQECYCFNHPEILGGIVAMHEVDTDHREQAAWVHIVSVDHGITLTRRRWDTCCGCSCEPTDPECTYRETDDEEPHTICESSRSVYGWITKLFCFNGLVACPDPEEGCIGFEDDICVYSASIVVSWPKEPACDDDLECRSPHNARDFLGRLTRVSECGGRLWLLRADAGSPRSGWDHELLWGSNIETPRGLWTNQFNYEMVYRDSSDGSVYWTRSTDDQQTFETPQEFFMAAKYPDSFKDARYVGYAVFKHDSGSSGPGKIYLRIQGPADNTPGAEFPVADAVGVPISFADDSFGITAPKIGPAPWILSATKAGDTVPTEFESTDVGESWEEV